MFSSHSKGYMTDKMINCTQDYFSILNACNRTLNFSNNIIFTCHIV